MSNKLLDAANAAHEHLIDALGPEDELVKALDEALAEEYQRLQYPIDNLGVVIEKMAHKDIKMPQILYAYSSHPLGMYGYWVGADFNDEISVKYYKADELPARLIEFVKLYLSQEPGPEYKAYIHPEAVRAAAREVMAEAKRQA